MVTAKLFVEGGGDTNTLRTNCRKGFRSFLEKAGLKGNLLRVVACGSRGDTFDAFCTAIENGENAFLLVDSEDAVKQVYQAGTPENWQPFSHLHDRDKWDKPANADETLCHLMTPCMEAWLIADANFLAKYFGKDFKAKHLPSSGDSPEKKTKKDIYHALDMATFHCTQKYDKGDHSFEILGGIDPAVVTSKCAWAKRFVDMLKVRLT